MMAASTDVGRVEGSDDDDEGKKGRGERREEASDEARKGKRRDTDRAERASERERHRDQGGPRPGTKSRKKERI